jgi:hypothetical protein
MSRTRLLGWTCVAAAVAMLAGVWSTAGARAAQQARTQAGPQVAASVHHDTSAPLSELAARAPSAAQPNREIRLRVPLGLAARHKGKTGLPDPLRQTDATLLLPLAVTPAPSLTFEGTSDDDNASVLGFRVVPPDTNGDVGPNHYMQWNNLLFRVFNKSGVALNSPQPGDSLWNGFGGICETNNDGDPIVLYDHLADRWVVSQFAIGADGHQCVAVSTTGDPLGSYYRYDFVVSPGAFNDYPKLGVWADAYYMSANEFGASFNGAIAVAFERDRMLLGLSAQTVKFGPLGCGSECFFSLQPSDLDGPTPMAGTPNTFVMSWDDETWGTGTKSDGYRLWDFSVNWTTPSLSTFTVLPQVNAAEFDANLCNFLACVTQPSPGEKLDTLSQFTMYRAQYRQFADHASLVVNHTVDANGRNLAGIRWAELRNSGSGWSLYQSGTYSPTSDHRWMGSIAMDKQGNIALGYSVSAKKVKPAIRYVTRLTGDALGTLPGGEVTMQAGAGVQQSSSNRWGDYSAMRVDPADDCTFWYTNEYYANNGSFDFKTKIGKFKIATCS